MYLIRHGCTAGNVEALLHGVTDVPLNDLGYRQARLIADRLADDVRVDAILSSPLSRALATASIIGQRLGFEPLIVAGLSEMNFGALEGVGIAQFAEDYPDLAARMVDVDDHDAGWPEGETRREFHERVRLTFEAILGEYASHALVVVAHGGVINSLVAQIRGDSPNGLTYLVQNCSLTHLDVTPDHTLVHLFNDAVHLEVLDGPVAADGETR